MRKLMSKKGFTLVELMIVVVILGILVAIAVPIFGAVTKNAKKKSCLSNMRVIKGNMETYAMTGGANGDQITLTSGAKISVATDASHSASFLKLFDGNKLPECPDDGEYTIYIQCSNDADVVIEMVFFSCDKHGELIMK